MSRRDTPWIVFDAVGLLGTGPCLRCLRCGERHKVALPMPVSAFVKVSNGFEQLHSLCKPSEPPSEERT